MTREDVEREPVRHARLAAELTGATVLLKGSTTLVVGPGPGGPVRSQADAPAWLATAGAGMFDELNRPNKTLRALLGVEQRSLEIPEGKQVTYLKQDLPFTEPIDEVKTADAELPVMCVRSRIATGGEVEAAFSDGSPAIVSRAAGKGRTLYCAFLPSLSYYQPAIPKRPVDRGATDDAMIHFLPTEFNPAAAALNSVNFAR